MVNWHMLIEDEAAEAGDTSETVAIAPPDLDLYRRFDNGYGGSEGVPFTLWTEERVYFPAVYDGSEWVESVSRNPNGVPTQHIGGE